MIEELLKIFESMIRNLDGRIGRKIRQIYYKKRLGGCGKGVIIEPGVFFQNPRHIFLNDCIWIDRYAILIAGEFSPRGRKFLKKENPYFKGKEGRLIIDQGAHIAPHVILQAHGGLTIGKNVTVASGAKIYTSSHHYKNLADSSDTKRYSFSTMAEPDNQFLIISPVVIEDNSAVGLNSVVLPGTTIRNGSWLGVLAYMSPTPSEVESVYVSDPACKKT